MFDEDERAVYEVRMQALADVESKIASAEQKGLEKGREEGREEGATGAMASTCTGQMKGSCTGKAANSNKPKDATMRNWR